MLRVAVIILSLTMMAASLSGCWFLVGSAAGGAGTVFWLSGKLSSEMSSPYDRVIEATKRALSSLDMRLEKETYKEDVSQIMSKYADGKTVWIDIRPVTASTTKVEVRVGAAGDKAASSKIMERIKRYL